MLTVLENLKNSYKLIYNNFLGEKMKSMKIIGLSIILSLFGSINSFANTIQNTVSDKLSTGQWQSIKKQIDAGNYKPKRANKNGFHAENPRHGWQINYQENGQTLLRPLQKIQNTYHIGLKLQALAEDSFVYSKPLLKVEESKFAYHWNENIKEIWTNTPQSLEQWFEIKQRPKSLASSDKLILQLVIDTNLKLTQENNALNFDNKITYDKLKVWDARGIDITAVMELNDSVLSLIIDDEKAEYPLTIDPVFKGLDYVKASNADSDDRFGYSVAIDGDTMVVGAPHEDSNWAGNELDNNLLNSGAVYVFVRNAFGFWYQDDYLKASYLSEEARFGTSVAISGDTIVVGAPNGSHSGGTTTGTAYVFTLSSGVWSEQALITASNDDNGDYFGISVSISGDFIVVGASNEASNASSVNGTQSNNSKVRAGAAYVFTRTGTNWNQQAYLKANNTDANDEFGEAVAIANNIIVVGARYEDSNAIGINDNGNNNSLLNSGAVYIFNRVGSNWSQQAYIKNSTNNETYITFGKAVAVDNQTVVVSMENDVAIYTRSANVWSKQASIGLNGGNQIGYGSSVALSGDILVIGDEEDSAFGYHTGSAHVYFRDNQTWGFKNTIAANNGDELDDFGASVALSGEYVVVGAPRESSNATGLNGDDSNNDSARSGAVTIFRESYKVNVSVTGLPNTTSFTLVNNNQSMDILNGSGIYTFNSTLFTSSPYNVYVQTQPNMLTCTVSSGVGSISAADVTIPVNCTSNSGNTAPIVVNDSYIITENEFLVADDYDGSFLGVEDDGVLVNDSDDEFDTLSVESPGNYTAGKIGGDLVIYSDGTFTYSPPTNTSGVATFDYYVTDGNLTTSATLIINIEASNDVIFKNGFE